LIDHKQFYIIWRSNLSVLSVPDTSYSRNTTCALKIPTFLLLLKCIKKNISVKWCGYAKKKLDIKFSTHNAFLE